MTFGTDCRPIEANAFVAAGSSDQVFVRLTNRSLSQSLPDRFVVLVLPYGNEVLETEPNNYASTAEELLPGQFGRGEMRVTDGKHADESEGEIYNLAIRQIHSSTIG